MIGILLITHANLGEAMIQCVCHVLNRRPSQLLQLGVMAQDDPRDLRPMAKEMLGKLDQGDGVVILTDLYGATPANLATSLVKPGQVEAIAGANLPMLLRVLNYREYSLEMAVKRAISGACDGVLHIHPIRTD
ncbi:PTS sugar transporter subunit IIA [Denitromonas ohlonensis]|uniref:PTS fructose transporter subunit IIA n=2 Tax=Denitromonas TaxID=139331 RepID=A0A558EGN6_9RHOO|nr:PTS fructose transporter subunit IIA [Denitromonas ohlonensis]TVT51133.1 MAG: PTS fructose transporter subunit IIA [Denitromonas halophila]TVO68465.1 PTS fructose transporter subunit IIA [Denitromonas ohlonensis]TVO74743.1 PTS fructose transporter subunit IIA [Denitromonas ohlonensis]TVT71282.1 MAG: PTS fructose transporter subunit IIA [Denitromonas halophila]TVT72238.1 MAG: PTS fructose transporter subunit IIA [Denitromonas halophila]